MDEHNATPRNQYDEEDVAPSPLLVVWLAFSGGLTLGALVSSFAWRIL